MPKIPKIETWVGVLFYTIAVTIMAIVSSVSLVVLIPHVGLADNEIWRGIIIPILIAPPLGLYGGYHHLRISRLTKKLKRIVNRDRLTDVATRDFFFTALSTESQAYGVSLMIDIDHFKQVNDTYGHFTGDQVIQKVAKILKQNVRASDIVCRFGGEEFVVFLAHAKPEEGWHIAERIRVETEKAVTATDIGPIKVTVSIGGSLKQEIEQIDDAIRRADACLYEAKNAGRNQTIVDWKNPSDMALQ